MFNELATVCQDELNLNLYVLSPETQLQIILDVSKVYETLTTEINRDSILKFEYLGRKLCFMLHSARQRILASTLDKSRQRKQSV